MWWSAVLSSHAAGRVALDTVSVWSLGNALRDTARDRFY